MDQTDQPMPAPRSYSIRRPAGAVNAGQLPRYGASSSSDEAEDNRRRRENGDPLILRDFDPNLYTYDHAAHRNKRLIASGASSSSADTNSTLVPLTSEIDHESSRIDGNSQNISSSSSNHHLRYGNNVVDNGRDGPHRRPSRSRSGSGTRSHFSSQTLSGSSSDGSEEVETTEMLSTRVEQFRSPGRSGAGDREFIQQRSGGGGVGTLESTKTGENFYSRINDDATLQRPSIYLPPPPSEPAPPMPPRFNVPLGLLSQGQRGRSTFGTQHGSPLTNPAAFGDCEGPTDSSSRFPTQFSQTPAGCVFVNAGNVSPPACPVLGNHSRSSTVAQRSTAVLLPSSRASITTSELRPQKLHTPPPGHGLPASADILALCQPPTARSAGGTPGPDPTRAVLFKNTTVSTPGNDWSTSFSQSHVVQPTAYPSSMSNNFKELSQCSSTSYKVKVKTKLVRHCSWKCIAIFVLVLAILLIATVSYLLGTTFK